MLAVLTLLVSAIPLDVGLVLFGGAGLGHVGYTRSGCLCCLAIYEVRRLLTLLCDAVTTDPGVRPTWKPILRETIDISPQPQRDGMPLTETR